LATFLNNPSFYGEFSLVAIIMVLMPLIFGSITTSIVKRWINSKKESSL
jgi:hypothetical protein